ncbi:MAG: hypothetical protein R2747_17370 [Pyrinomonadaceae bacterium]
MCRFWVVLLFVAAFGGFGAGVAPAQNADLKEVISRANEQTLVYEKGFRDLLAKETKTFEIYGKGGDLKKRAVIESNFLVYQSPRDPGAVSEFRDVTRVDGKAITGRDRTPAEFFSQVEKAGSIEKELEKVQKESLRFDKTLEIEGLTLLPAPVLADHIRPFFDFELVGTETFEDRRVFVVAYRQTRKSPYILINEKGAKFRELSLRFDLDLPGGVKKSDVVLSGRLWIDAETFQLRREVRQLTAGTENPLLLLKTEFEYQPSEYGIMVPKHITLTEFKTGKKDRENVSLKDTRVDFDYSQFMKTNVEVKVLDDEQSEQ